MKRKPSETRYDFIDVAKGIGVFLVIISHLLEYDSLLSIVIYRFHVPLFFLLSGLFAKTNVRFVDCLKKSTKRLLVPYLIFFAIGVVVTIVIYGFNSIDYLDLLRNFFLAKPTDINVGSIWFLAALFNVTILFNLLHRLILKNNNMVIAIFVLGLMCLVAFYLPKIQERIGFEIPFKIHVSLMAIVFYVFGFYFKTHILSLNFCSNIMERIFTLLVFGAVIVIVPFLIPEIINFANARYGSSLFNFLFVAFCGSFFVITLSVVLRRFRPLAYIGKNSLIIFSLHTLFILLYNYLIGTFDISNNVFISIIGGILILLIMVVLCLFFEKSKSIINNLLKEKKN